MSISKLRKLLTGDQSISRSFQFRHVAPLLLLPVLVCLLLLGGCGSGDNLAVVRGTVTHQSEPAPGLVVSFIPASGGRTSGGSTNGQGAFRLIYNPKAEGALVGNHEVRISIEGKLAKALTGKSKPTAIFHNVEVVSGNNDFDLKLEDFKVVGAR